MPHRRLLLAAGCAAAALAFVGAQTIPGLWSGGRAKAAPANAAAAETATPPGVAYHSATAADLRHAYFGDLHLHTTMSFDAWSFGSRVTPDQAYKFARGETVMVPAVQAKVQESMSGEADVPARRAGRSTSWRSPTTPNSWASPTSSTTRTAPHPNRRPACRSPRIRRSEERRVGKECR